MRECVTTDWIDYHDTSQDRNQESRRLINRWLARRWYVKAYLNDHEYMLIYERGLTNMKNYNVSNEYKYKVGVHSPIYTNLSDWLVLDDLLLNEQC